MNICAFSFYYKQKKTKYVIGIVVVLQQTFVTLISLTILLATSNGKQCFYPYLSQGKC